MANENDIENDDDLIVNVDDLDTVQVDVADNVKLAQEPEHIKEKQKKEPKTKRVIPEEPKVAAGPSPEQVLEEAKAFAAQQETARKAAEATAASERARADAAQREAEASRARETAASERANNSDLAVLENGIQAASTQLESLQEEYTRAGEAGEFAKMATIQTKIAKSAATLDRLENAKANFSLTTQTHEGRVVEPQVQQAPLDRYMAQFTPVAQNWLRQHPECWPSELGGDKSKNNTMLAGHYAAVGKNLTLNSPEYFKEIENHLNPQAVAQSVIDSNVASKAAEIQVAGSEPAKPRHVQPAAPISRDVPGQQARTVREVRLSKEQQEMAKVSFPHLDEKTAYGQYARNLIELEQEGKLGRLTH